MAKGTPKKATPRTRAGKHESIGANASTIKVNGKGNHIGPKRTSY